MENKQLCTITVMFPVNTDDEAIGVKKRVKDALEEIKDARIDFRIMDRPDMPR